MNRAIFFDRDGTLIAEKNYLCRPEDVVGAVLFLASPASGLVTGDSLKIDGGWTAR